ncbi:MAG: hypothetical protein ACI955_002547, partial [Zhongshania sp.]
MMVIIFRWITTINGNSMFYSPKVTALTSAAL